MIVAIDPVVIVRGETGPVVIVRVVIVRVVIVHVVTAPVVIVPVVIVPVVIVRVVIVPVVIDPVVIVRVVTGPAVTGPAVIVVHVRDNPMVASGADPGPSIAAARTSPLPPSCRSGQKRSASSLVAPTAMRFWPSFQKNSAQSPNVHCRVESPRYARPFPSRTHG